MKKTIIDSPVLTVHLTRPALNTNRKSANPLFPQPFARQIARAARIGLCTPGGNRKAGLANYALLALAK